MPVFENAEQNPRAAYFFFGASPGFASDADFAGFSAFGPNFVIFTTS